MAYSLYYILLYMESLFSDKKLHGAEMTLPVTSSVAASIKEP